MYKKHFGFRDRPFKLLPDPAYLYVGASHEKALAHLIYTVSEGDGIYTITGAAGTGKTTLCRAFIEKLDDKIEAAYINNPELSPTGLLKTVCDEFGLDVPNKTSTKDLLDALKRFLIEKKAEGKHVILIVDEAQSFSHDALEQIRLLSNLETSKAKLLQIALVGQMELNDQLNTPELKQLQQRVTLNCKLLPFTFEETVRYIQHRVQTAMKKESALFTGQAFQKIYSFSRGIPRLINNVCDKALLCAFVSNREKVCGIVVDAAIQESLLPRYGKARRRGAKTKKIALMAGALCSIAFLLYVILPSDSNNTGRAVAQKSNAPMSALSENTPAEPTASRTLMAGNDNLFSQTDGGYGSSETQAGSENGSVPSSKTPEGTTMVASAFVPVLDPAPGAAPGVPVNFFEEPSTASDFQAGQTILEKQSEPIRKITFVENEAETMAVAQNVAPLGADTTAVGGGETDQTTVADEPNVRESDSDSPVFEDKVLLASATVSGMGVTTKKLSVGKKTSATASDKTKKISEPAKEGGGTTGGGASEKVTTRKKTDTSEPASPQSAPENKSKAASADVADKEPASRENKASADTSSVSPSEGNDLPEKQAEPENREDNSEDLALVLHAVSHTQVKSVPEPTETTGKTDMGISAGSDDSGASRYSAYKPGEVDKKPKLVQADSPVYPSFAKRNNINGWVLLQFVVDTRGRAKEVQVLEEEPIGVFKAAALAAVADYAFTPAVKNGKDVNCVLKQRIRFELE